MERVEEQGKAKEGYDEAGKAAGSKYVAELSRMAISFIITVFSIPPMAPGQSFSRA